MSESKGNTISNYALDVIAGEYDSSNTSVKDVDGGYSRNRRAIVKVGDETIFIKEVDESLLPDEGETELGWLKKDHQVIESLRRYVPEVVPEWSKLIMDGHLLVMPSYSKEDGWSWLPPDDESVRTRYINKVVATTQQLEGVILPKELTEHLSLHPYFREKLANDDSIDRIISDESLRTRLIEKYEKLLEDSTLHLKNPYTELLSALKDITVLEKIKLNVTSLREQSDDSFNHCDVRSDNVAYNADTDQIKFVDWNWVSYAPKKFGATEFLIDMARRGIDIKQWYSALNPGLVAAFVGLSIVKSLNEPLSPTSNLRQMQAETGAIALYILNRIV